jgi:hypothetical protein
MAPERNEPFALIQQQTALSLMRKIRFSIDACFATEKDSKPARGVSERDIMKGSYLNLHQYSWINH